MPDDVDDDDEEDGSGDDEDEEEDQQDEDLLDEEDQDEGVDEEGPIGQWTKPGGPRNPGATIWLTNRKEMCRLVHPDGQYMDLIKKPMEVKALAQLLGATADIGSLAVRPVDHSRSDRVMVCNRRRSQTQPNEKAAAVMLRDVRGPVVFCERKFLPLELVDNGPRKPDAAQATTAAGAADEKDKAEQAAKGDQKNPKQQPADDAGRNYAPPTTTSMTAKAMTSGHGTAAAAGASDAVVLDKLLPAKKDPVCCLVTLAGTVQPLAKQMMDLKEAQQHVGGLVQVLGIKHFCRAAAGSAVAAAVQARAGKRVLLCNEDGEPAGLPVNTIASNLMGFPVRGNVVVCESGFF